MSARRSFWGPFGFGRGFLRALFARPSGDFLWDFLRGAIIGHIVFLLVVVGIVMPVHAFGATTPPIIVPVQVVRVSVADEPYPTAERAERLFQYAARYWAEVSGGRYTLASAGTFSAHAHDVSCWCDKSGAPGSNPRWGESELPNRPTADTVQLLITEHVNGMAGGSCGGYRCVIWQIGDEQSAAHEIGHSAPFGLGHAMMFDGDGRLLTYGNTWSVMGSGEGAPDGAHMQALGLLQPRALPAVETRVTLPAMGLPERETYTWLSSAGTRYFMDYRTAVGTDADVTSGPRVLIYTVSGGATRVQDELRLGTYRRLGGRWIAFEKAGDAARILTFPG